MWRGRLPMANAPLISKCCFVFSYKNKKYEGLPWCFGHCHQPCPDSLPQNKTKPPTLEEACFQWSLDSEMTVPFACYKWGWGHTIHAGVLGSLAQALGLNQCPHSRMAPMCYWSHRYTIVMLHYGFPWRGEEGGGSPAQVPACTKHCCQNFTPSSSLSMSF